MAAHCRRPKAERGQRPCFTCKTSGHLARNYPNKPVKAIMDAVPAPFATMRVTTVFADGFTTVPGPRPTTTTIHHLRPQITDKQQRQQQQKQNTIYRPLTIDDLLEVADVGSTAEISLGEVAGGDEGLVPECPGACRIRLMALCYAGIGSGHRTIDGQRRRSRRLGCWANVSMTTTTTTTTLNNDGDDVRRRRRATMTKTADTCCSVASQSPAWWP